MTLKNEIVAHLLKNKCYISISWLTNATRCTRASVSTAINSITGHRLIEVKVKDAGRRVSAFKIYAK